MIKINLPKLITANITVKAYLYTLSDDSHTGDKLREITGLIDQVIADLEVGREAIVELEDK